MPGMAGAGGPSRTWKAATLRPALAKTRMTVTRSPTFRGRFNPSSIRCRPPGLKATVAPPGIATAPTARMVDTEPTMRLSWIDTWSVAGLDAATSLSAARPLLVIDRYPAPVWPAAAGRVQASATVKAPDTAAWTPGAPTRATAKPAARATRRGKIDAMAMRLRARSALRKHRLGCRWNPLEAAVIPETIEIAGAIAAAVVAASPTPPSPHPSKIAAGRERDALFDDPSLQGMETVAAGIQVCRRCGLWRDATQGVPGEGLPQATLMFVGEQPGDLEDLRGRPFVGPAGELFDRALAEAGIAREACYVTNAVKHFKHEMRGKRRLHKTPNAGEIEACRWWLQNEVRLVAPRVVVAMGATAARAVVGRPVSVLKERGPAAPAPDRPPAFVTVHPSYLLRIPDKAARHRAFSDFVLDLAAAKALSR